MRHWPLWTTIAVNFICVSTALPQTQPSGSPDVYYSSSDMSRTPAGGVQFHGPFSNETLTVRYDDIATHEFLDISFDFLAIRSLDGSSPMKNGRPTTLGPDFFRLGMEGGATLFYTTFSNRPDDPGFYQDSRFQNFPSQVPGEHLKPQTGAAVANTLGYGFPWAGPAQFFAMDATYHIHFIIPDTANHGAVQIGAMNLSNIIDESWGITDVAVKPLSKLDVATPDEAAIEKAFATSLDPTSTDQPAAFQTLISGMDRTVTWMSKNVTPAPLDTDQLPQLVDQCVLDDHHVDERETAFNNLIGVGPLAEPYLRDRRTGATGDLRQRLDWALESISDTPITDDNIRRVLLATRVLETIRTPAAMELRAKLTKK